MPSWEERSLNPTELLLLMFPYLLPWNPPAWLPLQKSIYVNFFLAMDKHGVYVTQFEKRFDDSRLKTILFSS